MDAYVINLRSSKDRWITIQKSFESTGITLHRIDPEKPRKHLDKLSKRDIGSQSLFLTFLKLVKMAKKKRLPEILILEDDCKPAPKFLELWPKVKEWLDSNLDKWDIYSGGSNNIKDPKIIGSSTAITFFDPEQMFSAHFIYIHSGAYDAFINLYETKLKKEVILHGDIINNELKFIISYPFVAYQENGNSTLKQKFRSMESDMRKTERYLSRRKTRKVNRKISDEN
jgi:GR25 family glycosyltransferase involved in LPS biosynthesis